MIQIRKSHTNTVHMQLLIQIQVHIQIHINTTTQITLRKLQNTNYKV